MGERRAVFLDRDGVINRSHVVAGKPYAPRVLSEFRLLPGVRMAIDALKEGGFLVVVVTNQPDIGNGLVDRAVVEAMHARLLARTRVDEIRMCPHRQTDGCRCRKPKPGMILDAARHWGVDPRRCFMVGDRFGDIEAGLQAGCHTLYVDRKYKENKSVQPHGTVSSLPAAVRLILKSTSNEETRSHGLKP